VKIGKVRVARRGPDVVNGVGGPEAQQGHPIFFTPDAKQVVR
jgi:hypothetical protein